VTEWYGRHIKKKEPTDTLYISLIVIISTLIPHISFLLRPFYNLSFYSTYYSEWSQTQQSGETFHIINSISKYNTHRRALHWASFFADYAHCQQRIFSPGKCRDCNPN
jgi:hypothetical protein